MSHLDQMSKKKKNNKKKNKKNNYFSLLRTTRLANALAVKKFTFHGFPLCQESIDMEC